MSHENDKTRLLPLIKRNDLMELFPSILNIKKENFVITPSEYIREMSLTTEERHKQLVYIGSTKSILENKYPPSLTIIPHIVIFQRFVPRCTYSVVLQVRNKGKSILPMKMHCHKSLHFSATFFGSPIRKLAPGLTAEYKISFTPREVKDYYHELVFCCKEYEFNVPIIAIGARAILDIPDQIILNPGPVKLTMSKSIVIRNIGVIPASFNFISQSPFTVSPAKGFLRVQETMVLSISFEYSKVGEVTRKLFLIFETGEKLTVILRGTTENVSVRLDKNSIIHEDTYIGLKKHKSTFLHNNSESIIKFSWKKNDSLDEDIKMIDSLKKKYAEITDLTVLKNAEVEYFDLGDFESHKKACERILENELLLLEEEKFHFFHDSFSITPQAGQVLPKSFVEILVIFEPKSSANINAVAYLEVSGRENRLPLQIRGKGLGPNIVLSPQILDIDFIYLCSSHRYEVVATNKGDISGNIEYKNETSIFGGKIKVEPKSRLLKSGECGVFIVSFTSNKQGEFIEQLSFTIKESGEIISFTLTGKIVSPTLHFDRREINFGTIPFGFPVVREVSLNNLSVVPVTFSLKVLADGYSPSLSYKKFSSLNVKPRLPTSPKQFQIEPQESVVEPFSSKKVTLTLTANRSGRFLMHLEMDMWDSESGTVSCPIKFHSLIPTILTEPEFITIPFCFVNFPYTRSISLRNVSKVPGFFYIVPLDPNENSSMTISADIPQGVIEPSCTIVINITLITSALGRQIMPINLLIFGNEEIREVTSISCVGQGPVVTVSPNHLHWGEMTLLEESMKTLVIANESPIPTTINLSLGKENSPWSIGTSKLTLAPSESFPIHVNLFLLDRGKVKDVLKLTICNNKVSNVYLSATGVGSSLKITPQITPTWDLGTLFSNKKHEIQITLENKGRKPYSLVWSPFPEYSHFVSMKMLNPINLVFKIEPTKIDLMSGERKSVNLVVQSSSTGYFAQNFYCFASIGVPTKELHFTSEVFAEFAEPLINFDKSELRYWYNKGYDGTEEKLEDEVEISSMSVLPLRVHFHVRNPFRIRSESDEKVGNLEMYLKSEESLKLTIIFRPELKADSVSRTYNGNLIVSFRDHSKQFILPLNGQVNYPNVMIIPKNINFDFVPIATNVYQEINLVNISPLTVAYRITWNPLTSKLVNLEKKPEVAPDTLNLGARKSIVPNLEPQINKSSEVEASSVDSRSFHSGESVHQINNLEEPVAIMPKIEISNTDIKNTIFPLAINYYDYQEDLMDAYRLARSSNVEDTVPVHNHFKLCDITPFYGKLEKYSSQILAVCFCSDTAVSVHLEAVLSIKSGPTEIITIDAQSSSINFEISSTELHFGKQCFCKYSKQELKIRNTGIVPFFFETNLKKECHSSGLTVHNKGVIKISPSSGILGPQSDIKLKVDYLPRIPGNFEDKFKLNIGYLDPVIVTIKGFGTFPQVCIALPRTELSHIPPELGYIATANITPDWLLTDFPNSALYDVHCIKPYRSRESNLDNLTDTKELDSLEYDWEFIKHLEYLPTDLDIQLAIERVQAMNLMAENLDNFTNCTAYARSLPQFVVPAYEADLGTVVIGRSAERIVTVFNYGPLPAVLYVQFCSQLKEYGIQVRLRNRNELLIGTNFSFTISFSPKKNKFKKRLEIVEDCFYFEVYHGPKIPIKVLAEVTYPFLIAFTQVLNYHDVVCGCCKILNLKLKNPGLVSASWSLVFASDTKNFNKAVDAEVNDGRAMFHLNNKSGVLRPEEYCNIQITFKPDYEGAFSATLWVVVAESLEDLKVILLGEGTEPKLNVSENFLKFESTPPYPKKLDKYFTIENPCSFPVEFYFSNFDEQIFEENKIIRAVCYYYQTNEILLPVRKTGEGLPIELVNFYQILLEDLNIKFMEALEQAKAGNADESASEMVLGEDHFSSTYLEKNNETAKKPLVKSQSTEELNQIFNFEFETGNESSVTSIFQSKTSLEIEELLQCYIKHLLHSNPEYDPIKAAIKSTMAPPPPIQYREGLLIIFHGAPYTNSIQLANRAALVVGLQALGIDQIILEEAALARCEAGLTVKELIEKAYCDHVEIKPNSLEDLEELNEAENENGLESPQPDFEITLENIQKKFFALVSLRESLVASKNKPPKSSSAKSESSKKEKVATQFVHSMNLNAPIANITEDLIADILKFRLSIELSKGIVIEELKSIFFSSRLKVLTTVLKAAGNIQDIIAIILLNNYSRYSQDLLLAQSEKEKEEIQLQEKILDLMEEEDDENIIKLLNGNMKEETLDKMRSAFRQKRHKNQELFQKEGERFYENNNKKSDTEDKVQMKAKFDSPSKKPSDIKIETRKSAKRRGTSGKPGSEGVSKKDPVEIEFAEFETELAQMKILIENWDQRIGEAIFDGVIDVKHKKGQTPKKSVEIHLNGTVNTARGIQLWLADMSRSGKNLFTGVCNYLNTVLQERYVAQRLGNWPEDGMEGMTFSVVPYPPLKMKSFASDPFTLKLSEPILQAEENFEGSSEEVTAFPTSLNMKINRSSSQISFKGKRKGCTTAKRRKLESRTSIENKTMSLKKVLVKPEESNVKGRWILQPGETLTWRVRYFPVELGKAQQEYPIEIVNWKNKNLVLCEGVCDIPALDMTPEVIFPSIATTIPMVNPNISAYFYSYDAYDFGSIVYLQKPDGNRTLERNAEFTLLNKSTLPVDLTIISSQDINGEDAGGTPCFLFEPQKAFLRPGESTTLKVTVSPTKYGPHTEVLMFSVKDNPKIESIRVKFEGVKPNVTVDPRAVNFDRILLHRRDFREVVFTNNNLLPLFLKLVNLDKLPPQFTFSSNKGWIEASGLLKIEIFYEATEVQQIIDQEIIAQVFGDEKGEELVQEFPMTISAEAYDVALDVIFAEVDSDQIDFGLIRVESECSRVFNLRNIGKFLLGFTIRIENALLNNFENERISVSPHEGKLQPGKMFPIKVSVYILNEVKWQRVPLIKILLVEPIKGDELVATIPIEVSLSSCFPAYHITPYPDFNFGQVMVDSITNGTVTVKNKGHFPLSYTIASKSYPQVVPKIEDSIKKHSKRSAASKEKDDKGKKTFSVLNVGPFEITPTNGVIGVGEMAAIKIASKLSEVKSFEEIVIFTLNESPSLLQRKNELVISAEGCLPSVDFSNFKSIFREHFVCKTETEFICPTKFESYTLFIEDELSLYFKNVCLCKTVEARIHLSNKGMIECHLKTEVQADSQSFSVSPKELVIEPYAFGTLTLSFVPEAIEEYKGSLFITLGMPENYKNIVQEFKLYGNGVLPQIEITEPASKLPEGQTLVNFAPTPSTRSSTCSIAFTNVGPLICKVILELYNNPEGVFKLIPKPGTERILKLWEPTKPIDHTVILSMSPGDVAEFTAIFTPLDVKGYSSQIKLFSVDNPFENLCFKLLGEGFFEEIVIEKIQTLFPFMSQELDDSMIPICTSPGQYILNFNDCYVKKEAKALIRLVNRTQKDFFKFQWDEIQNITVTPSVGHLYPNSYKEILLVLQSEEPVELEEVPLGCTLNKISLKSPPNPSWDSRLAQPPKVVVKQEIILSAGSNTRKNSAFQSNVESLKTDNEEPECEIIPETSKMLSVLLSGTVDYARLHCDVTNIVFKKTFMFQTRIYPLTLQNYSNVAVEYKLLLKSVTAGPVRELKTTSVLEPSVQKEDISNRPQSWMTSSARSSLPGRCLSRNHRPRPLSSVSLLDLNKNTAELVSEEKTSELLEEQKTLAYNPFLLENLSGRIPPREKVTCNIKFSPMDINEYKAILLVYVPSLYPEYKPHQIQLAASSLMPYSHFNIPESDYLESGRRDYSRPGPIGCAPGIPLSPDTKTIEIKVLGTGHTVPLKFHVINPTEEDYTFSWVNVTQVQPDTVQSFYCSTLDGRIQAGRQQQMIFNFVSEKVGVAESFWKFCIPEYKVDTLFLFVTDVREPSVYFLHNHITLKPTFIGFPTSGILTLVNNEKAFFEYKFLPNSLYSEGRLNVLNVEPASEIILADSELDIKITFTGKIEGKTLFYLKCKVKGIQEIFTITVEATTYVVHPVVNFEDLEKVKHHASSKKDNFVNFGTELIPNRPQNIAFFITNTSKTSVCYDWVYDQQILETSFCKIKLSPQSGHVSSSSSVKCDLTLNFSRKSSLKNYNLQLKVRRGPTFNFIINASASTVCYEFSFTNFDFGCCFLQERDVCFNQTTLIIRNKDATDITLQGFLPNGSAFSYELRETKIQSGKETVVMINFHPKETIVYTDVLKFIINGIYERLITLTGRGIEFKVTLENTEDTRICLGTVRVGKSSMRKFRLINKSLGSANLLVGLSYQLPVDGTYLAKPEQKLIDLSKNHRLSDIITLLPSNVFTVKPQQAFEITVLYAPKVRTPHFSEIVSLQFQEKAEPLCILTACCIGPEILLDRSLINFGAVIKDCSRNLKLKILNTGSFGARFEWMVENLREEYTLFPISGYCSPESDVTIEVCFRPLILKNCITDKVECKFYLSENETYPSLFLTVTGTCVDLPQPTDIVYFECFVRETVSKTVEIENRSGNEWKLVPIFSGEYFKGNDAILVPSLSFAKYEIHYSPLTMTKDVPHKGSVFFRLPNGQGLLYSLKGTSLAPKAEDVIIREVPCKTKYVELLKIRNWLQYSQRFSVRISCVVNDNQEDLVWTCTGVKNLDLPSLEEKEYNLEFFAYKPGSLTFHVIFTNDVTNEYKWFDITFNIVECGPLEVISLKCGARQTCHYELKLENPTKEKIHYELSATSSEISFENNVFHVEPDEIVYAKISFTPIHAAEKTAQLTAKCSKLGIFLRELRLTAFDAQPEPSRTFKTPFGSTQTQLITIKNLSNKHAVFKCRVDSDDFKINEAESASPGEEIQIQITHEPTEMETAIATAYVESEEAGNFTFPLLGICNKPVPKGPFFLKPGTGITINFKNVFKKPKDFFMYVDNSAFVLKTNQEKILSKAEFPIQIEMEKESLLEKLIKGHNEKIDPRFPWTGQLVVECYNPYVKWQFYLKGIVN